MTERATVKESRYFIYSVYSNGDVTKASVKDMSNERSLPIYRDDGGLFVWISKDKRYMKWLVAKYFLQAEGSAIEHIDGDENNCAADNLRLTKRDTSNNKRVYTKVMIDGVEYSSIAAAERALMVSHGYLTRYFNGSLTGRALDGHEVKIVEEI